MRKLSGDGSPRAAESLEKRIRELSEGIIEYDYSTIMENLVEDHRRLITAKFKKLRDIGEAREFIAELSSLHEELLPVASPLGVLRAALQALDRLESIGGSVKDALRLVLSVLDALPS